MTRVGRGPAQRIRLTAQPRGADAECGRAAARIAPTVLPDGAGRRGWRAHRRRVCRVDARAIAKASRWRTATGIHGCRKRTVACSRVSASAGSRWSGVLGTRAPRVGSPRSGDATDDPRRGLHARPGLRDLPPRPVRTARRRRPDGVLLPQQRGQRRLLSRADSARGLPADHRSRPGGRRRSR